MKTFNSYRAEDGSLHETREDAAVADLIFLGLDETAAKLIVQQNEAVMEVLRCITGASYIRAYLPPPEAA